MCRAVHDRQFSTFFSGNCFYLKLWNTLRNVFEVPYLVNLSQISFVYCSRIEAVPHPISLKCYELQAATPQNSLPLATPKLNTNPRTSPAPKLNVFSISRGYLPILPIYTARDPLSWVHGTNLPQSFQLLVFSQVSPRVSFEPMRSEH